MLRRNSSQSFIHAKIFPSIPSDDSLESIVNVESFENLLIIYVNYVHGFAIIKSQ